MTEIPHTKIFYVLILLLGVAIAIVEYNAEDNPQVQANKDNIAFLIQQNDKLIETDKTIQEAIVHQTNRSANNTDLIGELEDYDKIITTQIGNIRSDILYKFPQSQGLPSEGQSSQSTPAFLTIVMDKTEFVLGNTVIFTGMAKSNNPVILTLKLPDRTLDSIGIAKAEIINGQWSGNFTLRLDDPTGVWQVYARQGAIEQTKAISFTVE